MEIKKLLDLIPLQSLKFDKEVIFVKKKKMGFEKHFPYVILKK